MGEKAERRNCSPKDVQRNKKRQNGDTVVVVFALVYEICGWDARLRGVA